MFEQFTPSIFHTNIIQKYLYSFSQATLIKYGRVDFNDLYTLNYPIYLFNVSDFQFDSIKHQQLYEDLFICKKGREQLLRLEDIKDINFEIDTLLKTKCFHLFSLHEFHFMISFDKDYPINKELFIIHPHFLSHDDKNEMEDYLYLLLQQLFTATS